MPTAYERIELKCKFTAFSRAADSTYRLSFETRDCISFDRFDYGTAYYETEDHCLGFFVVERIRRVHRCSEIVFRFDADEDEEYIDNLLQIPPGDVILLGLIFEHDSEFDLWKEQKYGNSR